MYDPKEEYAGPIGIKPAEVRASDEPGSLTRQSVVSGSGCGNCEMEDDPTGDYVEYTDAQAAIRAAVAEEREACAKLAEVYAPDSAMNDLSSPPYCNGFSDGQAYAAAAIRARGKA